jgi:hypothetical protein
MTPDELVRLLVEPARLRAFSAIAVGANTQVKIMETGQLTAKDVAGALRRLQAVGLIVVDDDGFRVSHELLENLARSSRPAAAGTARPDGDPSAKTSVHPFVKDRRLVRLPAQWSRQCVVLEHIVRSAFELELKYSEKSVNDILRQWCEGGETDHATLRRSLVDQGLLSRNNGIYRRTLT